MSILKRLFLFILLPTLAILLYPPDLLSSGLVVILVAVAFFAFLGFLVWRGHSLALTFLIFLQGMNVIIRLMMLWSNTMTKAGVFNPMFLIMGTLGLALSMYLLLRLDQSDVRVMMTR
jgi:hypothetical protein